MAILGPQTSPVANPNRVDGTLLSVSAKAPLYVELEGVLLLGKPVLEAQLQRLRLWAAIPPWRAEPRERISTAFNPALLPYNQDLLVYLRKERATGRRLILVTRGDRHLADAIAHHLGIFVAVVGARDAKRPDTSAIEVITRELGDGAFAYVGGSHTDPELWRAATSRIVVGSSPKTAALVSSLGEVEAVIGAPYKPILAFLKVIRPHQWTKNLLVFVPIITANALTDLSAWGATILTFVAFCCAASSIYIVNDLVDLTSDRAHPRKRGRPFAAGALSPLAGLAGAPLLFMSALGFAAAAGIVATLTIYVVTSLLYSLWLKARPLIDIFVLASLYTLRIYAGGQASGYQVSLWLFAFSSFLFFALATIKRVAELSTVPSDAQQHRVPGRGYVPADRMMLKMMGVASSFVSCLVLALYVQSVLLHLEPRLGTEWAIVPLVLFWQCRLWLATARGQMHDDPIVYAARDGVSWLVAALAAAALVFTKF